MIRHWEAGATDSRNTQGIRVCSRLALDLHDFAGVGVQRERRVVIQVGIPDPADQELRGPAR